jgi:hypothetical protein
MSEENPESLNEPVTDPVSFEEHVKSQFELILARLDGIESGLRAEMVERFLQLSRQVRDLDEKVDVFIKEQLHLKRELREVRDSLTPKH